MLDPDLIESDTTPAVVAAVVSLVGAAATLLLLAALHLLSPEFDPSFRMVSEYALGRYGWVLSLMFACWAVSTWAATVAIWSRLSARRGRLGRWALLAAGLGQALAAVFDINHSIGHNLAGLLGVSGLPLAALLLSASLDRVPARSTSRRLRRWLAHLTWICVVLLIASTVLMAAQFARVYGGHLPQQAPAQLPAGVIGLSGWADRLIVLVDCLWVSVLVWPVVAEHSQAAPSRSGSERPSVPASART